jgi:DNA repair exonuclease SbcCD ATPase subunit
MSKKRPADDPKPMAAPMTDEERAALETEKAALLTSLAERGARGTVKVYIPAATPAATPTAPAPAKAQEPAREPAPPTPPARSTADLRADLKALEQQLAEAQRQEAAYRQHQAAAAQREAQQKAREDLTPLVPKLDAALLELDRVQKTYGPTLRSMARSCASGTVEQRRALSEAYSAAAPMGQRLGEARRVLESALAGCKRASESGREHEVAQAVQLTHAALAVNIIALETDARVLVEAVEEVKGGRIEVQGLTPDRVPPMRVASPLPGVADLGGSILS